MLTPVRNNIYTVPGSMMIPFLHLVPDGLTLGDEVSSLAPLQSLGNVGYELQEQARRSR